MRERTLSSESSEIQVSEIKLDPQEQQDILDQFFKPAVVLTARIWSKHPRSRSRPRPICEIEVSGQADWRAVGRALRARFLERAGDTCDCYSCRRQHTKRGQREKYWVNAVVFALNGDPSTLVDHLNSRKALTQFDRTILADLLDAVFRGEIDNAWASVGRPKNIAARTCASVAIKFYKDWKAINQRWKIKDWGHSDEMKDEACRVAIDCHLRERDREGLVPVSNHPMDVIPDIEQVRTLMDRPRSRRFTAKNPAPDLA
jgi:hypothetical protein